MTTQSSTLVKLADIAPGMTFDNGQTLHAPMFDWHALLTVVRRDVNAYGCSRFTVSDSYGPSRSRVLRVVNPTNQERVGIIMARKHIADIATANEQTLRVSVDNAGVVTLATMKGTHNRAIAKLSADGLSRLVTALVNAQTITAD